MNDIKIDNVKEFLKLIEPLEKVKRGAFERCINYFFEKIRTQNFDEFNDIEIVEFEKAYAIFVEEMQNEPIDFLGMTFMKGEFFNKKKGQFFTPQPITYLAAALTLNREVIQNAINEKGRADFSEPCIGAGSMTIACVKVMRKMGFEPQRHMRVEAEDLDMLCVKMAYVQLTLLGIPLRISCGDTLTRKYSHTFINQFFIRPWLLKAAD